MEPLPTPPDFDGHAASYNELLRENTEFFAADDSFFARYKVDLVRRKCPGPINKILEFGCGVGRNIPHLRRSFPEAEITGSDISGESLKLARENNPYANFVMEDGQIRLGPFDLIFVSCVYHHIPEPERAEITRLLKRRLSDCGNIFIFEHNPYNPVTRRLVSKCLFDARAELLTLNETCRLMREAGLQVAARAYCLFFPPSWPFAAGVEGLLSRLPLGGQYYVQAAKNERPKRT